MATRVARTGRISHLAAAHLSAVNQLPDFGGQLGGGPHVRHLSASRPARWAASIGNLGRHCHWLWMLMQLGHQPVPIEPN